jgi:hypothetical protein
MPDTVTTYNVFVPGTKARSNEVNQNFNNYRGHLLPINELTATASDLTHDLGSASHRWRTLYAEKINLESSTSTAGLVFEGDTSATAGAFSWQIGSTEVLRVDPEGVRHQYLRQRPVSTDGSSTSPEGLVITADFAGTVVGTISATNIVGSTLTISRSGRPIVIGFMGGGFTTSGYIYARAATVLTSGAAQSGSPAATIYVCRDTLTTVVGVANLAGVVYNLTSGVANTFQPWVSMGPGILAIDVSGGTGTANFFLAATPNHSTDTVHATGRLYGFELF